MSTASPAIQPLILANIALRPLPLAPVEFVTRKLTEKLCTQYPKALERLTSISGKVFLINATDLPYILRLEVQDDKVVSKIYREEFVGADVKISGIFLALLEMMNSEVDGDSLFFSRDIRVEGDTEALLTLRNALDCEDINIEQEISSSMGIFKTPASFIANKAGKLFNKINQDIQDVSQTILTPIALQQDAMLADNKSLREQLTTLETKLTKQQKDIARINKRISK